ncbi:2-oxoglutarate and iron-dependent oxygenase JMJD4 [Euphorbia peplus]|nr:2-oxoglutarate and iron-dependent oxygenase JMJD4 [Euphorbia peplus]
MGIEIGGKIERVNGKEISYEEFVAKYLAKNQPVVLTGLMDDWRASKDWVTPNGCPNLHFFSTHFPNSIVQIADCGVRDFTDQKRVEMTLKEFIDHWVESTDASDSDSKSVLYLKDWHFVKEYPEYVAYKTPLLFCDDWLNLYLDHHHMHKSSDKYQENEEISCSDYRFVYIGAKGSWTPLHADVFRSYSWSANVCGTKKWLFLPPSQCHLIYDRNLKNTVYNIFDDIDEKIFPGFKKAIWLECIQEQNEIIFVPSGWFHQVHNLEDTISINHNWFNAHNLSWVWDLLSRDYNETKGYIEDIREICDDFEALCQRNLAANTGMNFIDFVTFLARFFLANGVQLCCHHSNETSVSSASKVTQHVAFNLECIQKIALKMKSTEGVIGNHRFLDVRETVVDPEFVKLCIDVSTTYGRIHDEAENRNNRDLENALVDDVLDYGSSISSLEEFVEFVNNVVTKLGNLFGG